VKTRYQKFVQHVLSFLQQGVSPEKLALGLAFGITLGIIPLLGVTTLLCALAALAFRLNMPFVQLVHYVVSPLQLILFIPFLHQGSSWFAKAPVHYTFDEITTMISNDFWHAVTTLFYINLCGVLLWLMLAPVLFGASYFIGLLLIRKAAGRFNKNSKSK
jgi:uncharacterized protein (DUF2062 family)